MHQPNVLRPIRDMATSLMGTLENSPIPARGHNAIVHNLPEQGTVWVTTRVQPRTVVLIVENTGETLAPQLVFTRVEPTISNWPRRVPVLRFIAAEV